MERKILKASDGMMFTDGEIYGSEIYLGEDVEESEFKEITIEEYNQLMEVTEDEIC